MIEEEIFKKCIFQREKCIEYGFQKEKNQLVYKTSIKNPSFQVILTLKNNKLTGTIMDQEVGEEYIAFRVEKQTGEFVSKVREKYKELLREIKKNCTIENTFVYPQSNRISNWIKETYGDCPEYLWDDGENAVFRNGENKKWYGIIMYIKRNKLDVGDEKVEVMNVKLPPEQIDKLVLKKGYYRAYHMNKKYWITFVLDDTIKDEELEKLIKISYSYTVGKKGR